MLVAAASQVNWTNLWSDVGSVCVLLVTVYGVVKWVINKATNKQDDRLVEKVMDKVAPFLSELEPNNGSSMKDAMGRIELHLEENKRDIHKLSTEFHRHLGQHDILDSAR